MPLLFIKQKYKIQFNSVRQIKRCLRFKNVYRLFFCCFYQDYSTLLDHKSFYDVIVLAGKVIYPKYSKHQPFTVSHTIDCVCSKTLNHGLNHWLFLSLFMLIPYHIHTYIELYMLAYLNFIFEF